MSQLQNHYKPGSLTAKATKTEKETGATVPPSSFRGANCWWFQGGLIALPQLPTKKIGTNGKNLPFKKKVHHNWKFLSSKSCLQTPSVLGPPNHGPSRPSNQPSLPAWKSSFFRIFFRCLNETGRPYSEKAQTKNKRKTRHFSLVLMFWTGHLQQLIQIQFASTKMTPKTIDKVCW